MSHYFPLGLVVGLLTVTAMAEDKPTPFDPAKLVGDWKVAEGTKAGQKDNRPDDAVTITKDTIIHEYDGKRFVFAYKLDLRSTPTAIDMTIREPEDLKGNEAKGITKLVGGKLTLCYHPMGGDRPKLFTSTAENGHFLWVFKKTGAKAGG